MRLAFMGTPEFAVPSLDALKDAGHEIVAVYSQPPRPTGRGHKTQPSPVHARADALGLRVLTPVSLKTSEAQAEFAALDLDAAVVAAYGLILPMPILEAPQQGCLNVHGSLLPRWRGAAPIQRALLAGDAETGITIMQMEAGLDTGPMLLKQAIPIGPEATATSLQTALSTLGAALIVQALDHLASGPLNAEPQPSDGVTYAAKLSRTEGQLDWTETAAFNERKVRALNPAPGVWFELNGERIKVLSAEAEPGSGPVGTVTDRDLGIACSEGIFRPVLLQRPGRGPVERRAFLNGVAVAAGTILPCNAIS
jgi:methionyl-tRNA formyltransferase